MLSHDGCNLVKKPSKTNLPLAVAILRAHLQLTPKESEGLRLSGDFVWRWMKAFQAFGPYMPLVRNMKINK